MGYMLIGTFLVAGSMGALEVDQIGYMQFLIQSIIGLALSIYGYKKDMAEVPPEECALLSFPLFFSFFFFFLFPYSLYEVEHGLY